MNAIDDFYLETQNMKRIAESYENTAQYWQIVSGMLEEEIAGSTDLSAWKVKRERRRIRHVIRVNAKAAKRINIKYNHRMRKYYRKVQEWAKPTK